MFSQNSKPPAQRFNMGPTGLRNNRNTSQQRLGPKVSAGAVRSTRPKLNQNAVPKESNLNKNLVTNEELVDQYILQQEIQTLKSQLS